MTTTYYIELLGVPSVIAVFVLLLAFPFALLALAVVAIAALAGVVVLIAGAFAAPVLLARAAWRHLTAPREHEQATDEIAYPAHATVSRTA
jgi:hypothetical protein